MTRFLILCLVFFCFNLAKAEIIELSPSDSIQGAIDNAQDFDTIQLAVGTYIGDIDFKAKRITIKGFGEDTVIQGLGNNPVVSFTSGEDNNSILDFVSINDGNEKGAILIRNSSPTIRRCFILRNRSIENASAIYINGEAFGNVAQIHNNIIAFNRRNKREGKTPA